MTGHPRRAAGRGDRSRIGVPSRPVRGAVETHALITGGTGGIGKATATELARRGFDVTITGRDATRAEIAAAEIEASSGHRPNVVLCDLANLQSVTGAAREIRDGLPEIDVFVANAGVAVFGRRRTTDDGFERQFGVNHLGHFVLTTRLADRIMQRVVVVSSAGYAMAKDGLRWDDLQWEREYDGWQAYGASKLCNLYFTWELADRLASRGVTANALHPGFVDTDLGYRRPEEGGKPKPAAADTGNVAGMDLSGLGAPRTPEDGARTSVFLATDDSVARVTGAYFDDEQQRVDVSPIAADRDEAARLWRVTEELLA